MKKCALWIILLFGAVAIVSAQRIPVIVNEVKGTGSTPDDNIELESLLNRELRARGFILPLRGISEMQTDYSFTGTLEPSIYEEGKFYLEITLKDYNDVELDKEGIFYTTLEDAKNQLPDFILRILSSRWELLAYIAEQQRMIAEGINDEEEEKEEQEQEIVDPEVWRNQTWYFGAGAYWNPRLYYGTMWEAHLANFCFGFLAEYHPVQFALEKLKFLKYFAAGTGIELASDWVVASPRTGDNYSNTMLQIPFSLNGVFRPGAVFLLQPYLGIQLNIPFSFKTTPSLLSWKAGFQGGIKTGRGIMFADIRYSMDFSKSGLDKNRPGDTRRYQRYMIYIGFGYKYGYQKSKQKLKNNNTEDAQSAVMQDIQEENIQDFPSSF